MTRGIYFIENTINEWHTSISGYFATQGDAMKALEDCCNWYSHKGTGTIYYQEYGLGGKITKVYEVR